MLGLLLLLKRAILGILSSLLGTVSTLGTFLLGNLSTLLGTDNDLVVGPVKVLTELGPESSLWGGGSVAEVGGLLAGISLQLIGLGVLWHWDSVRVEVGLEVRVGPGVESVVLGSIGLLSEVRGDRSVDVTTGGGGRGVLLLGSLDKILTGGVSLLSCDLGLLVTGLEEPVLEVVISPGIVGPGVVASGGLMGVLADSSKELVLLSVLWDWNTTGIKVSLQASLGPLSDGGIESLLSLKLSIIGGASERVTGTGGSGTVGRRSGGLGGISALASSVSSSVTSKLGTVLAGNGEELGALRSVWNLDAVLVSPSLDLRIIPRVKDSVGDGGSGGLSGSRGRARSLLRLQSSETRVAADRSNELVARSWLWCWDTVGIEPVLKIRLGPGLVEPVAWVVRDVVGLFGSGIVTRAEVGQESITVVWLWNWDTVLVGESLQLGVGPADKTLAKIEKSEKLEKICKHTCRRSSS